MDKLMRMLIEDGQISLVAIDSTTMVRHAQIIHGMTPQSAETFGRVITFMTYMSCWLKDGASQLSVSVKHHGETGEICVSGNGSLFMRGYVYNPSARDPSLGKGYITLVRDNHYKTPFVGTCELVSDDADGCFEYYYRLSEQLPTYIRTAVRFDGRGLCKAAGGIFLQPMPGASERAAQYASFMREELADFGDRLQAVGLEGVLRAFGADEAQAVQREPQYRCMCSRQYISGILRTMGEAELREIVCAEGKVSVHCHYCNSDYDFFESDIDALFPAEREGQTGNSGSAE